MTEKHYDVVILGATFEGLGAALSMKGQVAVIERSGLFGAEFVDCFKVSRKKDMRTETKKGTDFIIDLKRRGLVNENGEIYPAPTVYVLSSYLQNRPMDIYLMTEIISVKKREKCFELTIFNAEGFCTVTAERILDTTTFGTGHTEGKNVRRTKSLNAIIYNPDGSELDNLYYNSINKLFYFHMSVAMDMSRYDAIEMLCAKESEFAEKNMRISTIAQEFAYEMEPVTKKVQNNFLWIPSAAYSNLAEAFDKGALAAEGGVAW